MAARDERHGFIGRVGRGERWRTYRSAPDFVTLYLLDENVLGELSPKKNAKWARLLADRDKHQRDRALAATGRAAGSVLLTRNITVVMACDVQVLDPFVKGPIIETV